MISSLRYVDDTRRRYPRAKAPIYYRPARFRSTFRLVVNIGLGGMRVYSDAPMKRGTKLELDLLLPDGASVTCVAEVAWSKRLEPGSPADYDVGLTFLSVPDHAVHRLHEAFEAPESA